MIGTHNLGYEILSVIGDNQVEAIFLSTFTFGREFFEKNVLNPLTEDGSRRGLVPVTIVVDRKQYRGSGNGYQVVRSPKGRIWHAKTIIIMIKDRRCDKRQTVFIMGSANVTRSGWEMNDELMSLQLIDGWRIPNAVTAWFSEKWLCGSDFAIWARKYAAHAQSHPKHFTEPISSLSHPIWEQLDLGSGYEKWTEAHLVAPFFDSRSPESDVLNNISEIRSFLSTVADRASSRRSELHLYLCSATHEDNRVIGNQELLEHLSHRVKLRLHLVHPRGTGQFHAKLFAFRCGRLWRLVTGSANATGPAMTNERGNIELAQEWVLQNRTLPKDMLPESSRVSLKDLNFGKPVVDSRKYWDVLEKVNYDPENSRLILQWTDGHGAHDTRVYFSHRKLICKKGRYEVDLSQSTLRYVETLPCRRDHKCDPGCCPIDVPSDFPDTDTVDRRATTQDEWLEALGQPIRAILSQAESQRDRPTIKGSVNDSSGIKAFIWSDKVHSLDRHLRSFKRMIMDCSGEKEAVLLKRIAVGVWSSYNPKTGGLPAVERAWCLWVRAGLWQVLADRKNATRYTSELGKLATAWRTCVPQKLRRYPIAPTES